MRISKKELQTLSTLLGMTEVVEINCEEFLAMTPAYLEKFELQEDSLGGKFKSFYHHLSICPECREELEALCEAKRAGHLDA